LEFDESRPVAGIHCRLAVLDPVPRKKTLFCELHLDLVEISFTGGATLQWFAAL
jgi:hypothetical protein